MRGDTCHRQARGGRSQAVDTQAAVEASARLAPPRSRVGSTDNGAVKRVRQAGRMLPEPGVRRQSTLVAVLVVASGLVAGTLLLLTLLHSALNEGLRETATEHVASVAQAVAARGPAELAGDATAHLVGASTVVQVVDSGGGLVYSTATTAQVLSGVRPEPGQWVHEGASTGVLPPDEPYVVATAVSYGGADYVVLGVSSQAAQRNVLGVTASALGITTPLLVLLAGLATWWLTGRALQPVEAIRREVARIEYGRLTDRVPVPGTRDEVAALATTMNDMLARLEAAQATSRRFVSDAGHELRSPLATLAAAIELAWRDDGSRAERAELTELMDREVTRMRRLVDDLLVLAKAEDRGLQFAHDDVDLDDVVETEARRLRAQSRHAVRAHIEPVRVTGDADRLTQVVRNLCDNAERAARSTLELSVRADRAPDGRPEAVLTVADDGAGIAPADRERVFGRFVRLDDARARSAGGSGLGLAIVEQIVSAHGGSVCVIDGPLAGACFEVRLPAQPVEAQETAVIR